MTTVEQALNRFPVGSKVRFTDPTNVPLEGLNDRANYEMNSRDSSSRLDRSRVHVVKEVKSGPGGYHDARIKLVGEEHRMYIYPTVWLEPFDNNSPEYQIEQMVKEYIADLDRELVATREIMLKGLSDKINTQFNVKIDLS